MSQEIKKLEMAVNTEQHLKYELQLDLQDMASDLEKKGRITIDDVYT